MTSAATKLSERLSGRTLVEIECLEFEWRFVFAQNAVLQAYAAWRVIAGGKIVFTKADHGQKFGLQLPLDGVTVLRDVIGVKAIHHVEIDTGDISISFDDNVRLEILNMSSGYESWEIGAFDMRVIGVGGGDIAIYQGKGS